MLCDGLKLRRRQKGLQSNLYQQITDGEWRDFISGIIINDRGIVINDKQRHFMP